MRGPASRQAFKARGGSMYPFVPAGSELSVERVSLSALQVGDIVAVLAASGDVVAHRLWEPVRGDEPLCVRGDAMAAPERIPQSAYVGRVAHVARGFAGYATDGPLGRLLARIALRHRWLHHGLSRLGRLSARLRGRRR